MAALWTRVLVSVLLVTAAAADLVGEVLVRTLARPFAPVEPKEDISPLCVEHSMAYLQALSNHTPWAIHMYDATAKIPSGVVTGNIQQLGNYDQCLQINVRSFRGQLCSATVQVAVGDVSNPTTPEVRGNRTSGKEGSDLREFIMAIAEASDIHNWTGPYTEQYEWAFCVPSSCSAADVQAALSHALLPLNAPKEAELLVAVLPERCLTRASGVPMRPADYGFIATVAVVAAFIIISTIYDLTVAKDKDNERRHTSKGKAILVAFSLYSNGKSLISTTSSSDTMGCLNGLRFLSIMWIIFGHTYYQMAISPQMNAIVVKYFREKVAKMLLMNATLPTDTFFLLSGILLSFVYMRDRKRKLDFNIVLFYLHRYIRLTPVYAIVIFFYATVFQHMGSGPQWSKWVTSNSDYCASSWWTNLLYVNNYVHLEKQCMSQSWYLAVDMQLFWASPLLLLPLKKWPRAGKVILGAAMMAAIAIPFTITVMKNLRAAMLYTAGLQDLTDVFINIYIPAYTRAGPYIIGIALGYLLFITKDKTVQLSRLQVAMLWLLSAVAWLASLFGVFGLYQHDHPYSAVESGMYAALHRSTWAAAVGWVVFACVKGYGGPVNTLLSWSAFGPLSRLTYCAYLSHFAVLLYNAGSSRTAGYLSDYNVVRDFLGNLAITLAVSAVLALAFEIPFMVLDKALVGEARHVQERPSVPTRSTEYGSADSVETTPTTSRLEEGLDNTAYESSPE